MLWLMLLCYYSAVASAIAGGCSITDVSASIVTSTTVLLRWSESEDCSVKNYSITASHVKYKACPAHVTFKEPSIVTSNAAEATKALVSGLEPYSIYTFNISSRIDNGFLVPLKTDFQAETDSARPQVQPQSGLAVAYTQAISFSWELGRLDTTCQKQRGKFDGFYLEFYGLDPWHTGLIMNDTVPENVLVYYAQNLKPFTAYQLMVYVRNQGQGSPNGDLYNKDLPLKLKAQTRPHRPQPPKNTRASVVKQDIHLRWQPSTPLTGQIKDYKLRFGPKTVPKMVWQQELMIIANQTDLCSTIIKKERFVCTIIPQLKANTTYAFQVQAFNVNVTQPSDFSDAFEATTDPLPQVQTPKPQTVEEPEEEEEPKTLHSFSSQVIVISVLTVIVIIVLVIIIAALIYKNKMIKLKAQYEASQRQLQIHDLSRSLSVIGYNESIADTTITSVSNYRAGHIQNRRLPDPPMPSQAQDFYVNNPDLIANVRDIEDDEEDDHYLKPMTFEEEAVNNDYLKPTFEYPKSDTDAILRVGQQHSTIIPTESYAVTLEPPRTISPLSQDNEIRPLILSLSQMRTTNFPK